MLPDTPRFVHSWFTELNGKNLSKRIKNIIFKGCFEFRTARERKLRHRHKTKVWDTIKVNGTGIIIEVGNNENMTAAAADDDNDHHHDDVSWQL